MNQPRKTQEQIDDSKNDYDSYKNFDADDAFIEFGMIVIGPFDVVLDCGDIEIELADEQMPGELELKNFVVLYNGGRNENLE